MHVCVRVGVAVCELFVYYNALCLYGAIACVRVCVKVMLCMAVYVAYLLVC